MMWVVESAPICIFKKSRYSNETDLYIVVCNVSTNVYFSESYVSYHAKMTPFIAKQILYFIYHLGFSSKSVNLIKSIFKKKKNEQR